MPQAVLDQGPVGDPAVPGHGVEVEVAVQVVPNPLHLPLGVLSLPPHKQPYLPHYVRVLAIGSRAHVVGGSIHSLLKVVNGHTAVVEATNEHVRMVGVDVARHHLVSILYI